jgi:hypothetical protein
MALPIIIMMVTIATTNTAPVWPVEGYVAREERAALLCVGRKLRNLII